MLTVSVVVTLRLIGTHSLKEKRAVIRSLIERLRARHRLAAAEVGLQDDVRQAEIGFAAISGEAATARAQAENALRFIDDRVIGRAEVIETRIDEFAPGEER
jgi:uncharacterized protein YlxP (DUF503 family)